MSAIIHFVLFQVMRSETLRLSHEHAAMREKIRDNGEKIKQNKVLPYLVGNVVEVSPKLPKRHISSHSLANADSRRRPRS